MWLFVRGEGREDDFFMALEVCNISFNDSRIIGIVCIRNQLRNRETHLQDKLPLCSKACELIFNVYFKFASVY